MLHFPCPKCGGNVETAEDNSVSLGNRSLKQFASGGMTGHSHPLLGIVASAITVGNFIYQRVPGGGRKRCTDCGHEFS